MKTNIEKLEGNLVKVNVEIEEQTAANEYNKACRKISDTVNIHGFRKGKAPKNIVEKYVGVERIQREALSVILPKIFADVISENEFDVITEPQVESFEFEQGKPLSVIATIEIKPEVKLGAYKDLIEENQKLAEIKVLEKINNGRCYLLYNFPKISQYRNHTIDGCSEHWKYSTGNRVFKRSEYSG